MIKLLADSSLSHLDTFFGTPFQITRYNSPHELRQLVADHDILLCRSTLRVDGVLLRGSRIRCVATASSGTDHIDGEYLKQHDITLLDAKGANARAVTDYVIACMAYLQHHKILKGLRAGVVGAGAVGSSVAARLRAIGFDVVSYDPLRAMYDTDFETCDVQALFDCDVICLHPNLHRDEPYASYHLLDASFLSHLKPKTVIINASRGHVVDEVALLTHGKHVVYCTDVYAAEPDIHPDLVAYTTLCTPHIAGHSIEARHNALVLLSQKIHMVCGLPWLETQESSKKSGPEDARFSCWQDAVLSVYDPMQDTSALKHAVDLSQQFIERRRAHHRHDFRVYDLAADPMLQDALGKSSRRDLSTNL